MMNNKNANKNFLKIVLPLVLVLATIFIVKSGYKFGHWLYDLIHR
jgi:uncharacterized membrane protein YjdF